MHLDSDVICQVGSIYESGIRPSIAVLHSHILWWTDCKRPGRRGTKSIYMFITQINCVEEMLLSPFLDCNKNGMLLAVNFDNYLKWWEYNMILQGFYDIDWKQIVIKYKIFLLFCLDTADGDYEKIWNEHCEDEVSLGEYAYAMQHLAQEHWSAKHADDRIKWCHDACIEYFFQGGMKTVLEKDRRRRVHHGQRKEESRWPCNGSALVRNVNGNSNGNNISSSLLSSLEDFHQQYFDLAHPVGNRHNAM